MWEESQKQESDEKMFAKEFQEVKVDVPEVPVSGWLPIPPHFDQADAGKVYNADAMSILPAAREWGKSHNVPLSATDGTKMLLMIIDAQLTFCHPDFTLFVGGETGIGAVEDNVRLSRFIYGAAPYITDIAATMDTHRVNAIFHESMIVDQGGNHIPNVPPTPVSYDDVLAGKWRIDPSEVYAHGASLTALQQHLIDYTRQLAETQHGGEDRYDLIIWPYHAMLGSIEHALAPCVQEAMLWHHGMRRSRTTYEIKGADPMHENYSIFSAEVESTSYNGHQISHLDRNVKFLEQLLEYDVVAIAGQASSHCVAWTIQDLLNDILAKDPSLASKVHILEDCSSPVVVRDPAGNIIPGPYTDFRPVAAKKMDEFKAAGMHVVKSTDPVDQWPGYKKP